MQKRIIMTPYLAKEFVNIASKCNFDIDVASNNRYYVDAKSILGVLGLDMSVPLTVSYNGFDPDLESFLQAHMQAC